MLAGAFPVKWTSLSTVGANLGNVVASSLGVTSSLTNWDSHELHLLALGLDTPRLWRVSFILSPYSQLMSSLSLSLMVVVASLNTPIVCLANVIELFCKMIVVLRFRALLLVWVCSIRRGVVSRSCHSCQSLAVDLGDLIECWCTKLCSANVSLVWTLSSL